MREDAVANVALARTVFLDLKEITGALDALFRAGALGTAIDAARLAYTVL